MAGKQRPGLDYSQIGCDFALKEKSVQVRIKFGTLGHLVLYEVIAWINGGKGCYVEYTDNTPAVFAMSRLGDLSKAEEIKSIFLYMLEIGFFDREAFKEDQILTSEGIVERWYDAKRSPDSYDMPCAIRKIIDRIKKRREEEKLQECRQNAQECRQNEQECRQSKVKYSNKQTNKQTSAEGFRDETPDGSTPSEPDCGCEAARAISGSRPLRAVASAAADGKTPPEPTSSPDCGILPSFTELAADARGREGWPRARNLAKEQLYFRGISADLIDAAAVCLVHGWLGSGGLRNIRRKARDALDTHAQTRGRRGKTNGWETVRDCVSLVIREQGLEPPAYSRKNPEPPPAKEPQTAERS